MKRSLLAAFVISLLTFACEKHHNIPDQTVRYFDDGRAKALVTITPVFDHNNINLPWNLAEDMTLAIQSKLASRSKIFLLCGGIEESKTSHGSIDDLETQPAPEPLVENTTLNINETALKAKYPDSEFVVFLELAKHNFHPRTQSKKWYDNLSPSYVLDVAMRIRIYDLRFEQPKVILHELIEQSHAMPKQLAKTDFNSAIWGKNTYSISPVGFAHTDIVKEVTSRIESYLMIAKSA